MALREAGAISAADASYQRGVRFLLSTQLEDGSWYVQSRSLAFQPYFESGFPHGHDQWVSECGDEPGGDGARVRGSAVAQVLALQGALSTRVTVPPLPATSDKLNDYGYFLAGRDC